MFVYNERKFYNMKIFETIKKINDFFDKLDNNKPHILDIIPKTKGQLKFGFLLLVFSILSLAVFTLILSLVIK